jgi:hypothetical protein
MPETVITPFLGAEINVAITIPYIRVYSNNARAR